MNWIWLLDYYLIMHGYALCYVSVADKVKDTAIGLYDRSTDNKQIEDRTRRNSSKPHTFARFMLLCSYWELKKKLIDTIKSVPEELSREWHNKY